MREAVAGGADGLAMAGGDGSQAVVAAIAAELDLPYACVPAGTRNHFALDLGVDRDDVVGALDAFVDGGERIVDLAEVNGRVFVNNVSLGLYADAVQREGYRDAKLRTLLDTVPDVLGPDGGRARHALDRPGRARTPLGGDGARLQQQIPARPRCRLGHAPADRRRPARDHGRSASPPGAARAAARCSGPCASGRRPASRSTPTAPYPPASTARRSSSTRRCAFASGQASCACASRSKHPGASPSAMAPEGAWAGVVELARIAAAGQQPPTSTTRRPEWT